MTGRDAVVGGVGALVTAILVFTLTAGFYEKQLDRLAANPLCAAACNVLKMVRR
jgi:hypothetical protein